MGLGPGPPIPGGGLIWLKFPAYVLLKIMMINYSLQYINFNKVFSGNEMCYV